MLKKFLVLCVMLFSLIVKGDEENRSATNVVAGEGFVETSMSDEATLEEIDCFAKTAEKKAYRALELSMYYQGWGKSECFYALDDKEKKSPISRTYVKNSELSRQVEMRDFNKALYWAEVAFRIDKATEEYLDKRIGLNLMKLYIMRGENFAKETYDFFIKNIANYDFEKEGKVYGRDFARKFDGDRAWGFTYKELYAYFYFKGFGVKQDIEFSKEILSNLQVDSWRSFYLDKYFLKDLDFVKFSMENSGSSLENNHFLYLIYSGKFTPSEKDETLAAFHFDKYEEIRNKNISEVLGYFYEAIENKGENSYSATIIDAYITKYIYMGFLFDEILLTPNPYYNLQLAEKHLGIASTYNEYKSLFRYLLCGFSIKDATDFCDEMLKSKQLSEKEKSELKKFFEIVRNTPFCIIFNNTYNSDLDIDFNNL